MRADHPEVEIPASRLKKEMSRILVEQGYVNGFEVEPTKVGESIRIQLKYTEDRDPVIQGMKRISRPGGAATSPAPTSRACRAAWALRSSPPRPV